MKGWYGNRQAHSLASRGIRSSEMKLPKEYREYDAKTLIKIWNIHYKMFNNVSSWGGDATDHLDEMNEIQRELDNKGYEVSGEFTQKGDMKFMKSSGLAQDEFIEELRETQDEEREREELEIELRQQEIREYEESQEVYVGDEEQYMGLGMKKHTPLVFYSDAGHGWLEVPISTLKYLGLEDKISNYSYIRGDFVYLEEDQDAMIFINAFEKEFENADILDSYDGGESKIRNYDRYVARGYINKNNHEIFKFHELRPHIQKIVWEKTTTKQRDEEEFDEYGVMIY